MAENETSEIIPAHWYLTVKTGGKVLEWRWKPEEEDNARRIYEAYRNTIKSSAHEIHENGDYYILADSGWADLTFVKEQEIEHKKCWDRDSGIIFMPYCTNIINNAIDSNQ